MNEIHRYARDGDREAKATRKTANILQSGQLAIAKDVVDVGTKMGLNHQEIARHIVDMEGKVVQEFTLLSRDVREISATAQAILRQNAYLTETLQPALSQLITGLHYIKSKLLIVLNPKSSKSTNVDVS